MDNEPNNDANERVLALVQDWQQSIDPISTVDSDSIRSLQLTAENDEFNFIQPQFTKDIYYSIFVDTLLQLGRENGGDIYITLEAILSMAFTPSPRAKMVLNVQAVVVWVKTSSFLSSMR